LDPPLQRPFQPTVEDPIDPVGPLLDKRVVTDHDHRHLVAVADGAQQVEEPLRGRRVQRACWLVGQKQPGLVDERPGYRNPLPLSPGELVGPVVGPVKEANLLEQLQSLLRPLPPPYPGSDQRHFDVLAGGQHRQQKVVLEDEPDEVAAVQGEVPFPPDLPAIDQDPSLVGSIQPADQVQQGALARPGPAGDPDELARLDLKVDVPHRPDLAVALADPL